MSEHKIIERLVDDLITRVEALEEKADEIWVPIDENPSYFISNKGRVKTYYDFYPKISVHKNTGYCVICLNRKTYKLHRLLAQAFIPNPEGKPYVDHKDGNKENNSLSNLRWSTNAENQRNTGKRVTNTTGFKRVTFLEGTGKYRARITLQDGREKHLGYFDTAEAASAVYEAAAKELYGEFYRAQ